MWSFVATSITLVLVLTEAALPGVRLDEGYFWHITDHHYDTTYWSDMRSCNDQVPVPGIYGDYWCDSPWRLVNDSIVSMANVKRDVDFILWTGDNVAHIANSYLNITENLAIVEKITDALKTEFPGVKVYATMGNHDWYPSDQFPAHSAFLYNATAELWKEWIDDDEQVKNFRKGGFYTSKLKSGERIVALNTILYYNVNNQTAKLNDPADQFAWLQGILGNARKTGEKVILTGHIPPGIKVPGKVLWFYKNFNKQLLDLIQTYADVIPAMYFGHDHADEFKLVKTRGGSPGIPMFMAPSVTPWRYKTPTESADPHNPAFRLFKYKKGTGLALDYMQYYMDLPAANKVNQSTWKIAYNASDAYKVTDLSATSVDNLVKKMEDDDSYLDNYIRFNTVLANGDNTVKKCDETCKAEYKCAFTSHETETFDTCVSAQVSGAIGVSSLSYLVMPLAMTYDGLSAKITFEMDPKSAITTLKRYKGSIKRDTYFKAVVTQGLWAAAERRKKTYYVHRAKAEK